LLQVEKISEQTSEKHEFESTAQYFGIAAIVVAIPAVAIIAIAALLGLPPAIMAILTVIALIMTTGALHEDALADVADGYGGGSTRDKKLDIMRDSQIGTYGACALILSIALQISCFIELISSLSTVDFVMVIVAANVATTSVMVWPWATQTPARNEGGLSSSHGMPSVDTAKLACAIGFSMALVLLWIAVGLYSAAISLGICWLCMMAFSRFSQDQIGGHTGDSLGATKKLSELGLLLTLIIAT
jgi:adenosylcobinamide-GDP ribazoletransferase